MKEFLSVFGAIVVLLLLLIIFAICVSNVLEKIRKIYVEFIVDAKELARKELGEYIAREAYWFSESKDAQELMRSLGRAISTRGVYSVDVVRSEWRQSTGRNS